MISQIHLFNPGHETAVLLAQRTIPLRQTYKEWYRSYHIFRCGTPTATIMYLRKRSLHPVSFLYNLKSSGHSPHLFPEKSWRISLLPSRNWRRLPWGISPHSLHFFEKLKQELQLNLSVPTWKEEYFRLTGRQTAAECLERIRQLLPDLPIPLLQNSDKKIREIEKYHDPAKCPFCL